MLTFTNRTQAPRSLKTTPDDTLLAIKLREAVARHKAAKLETQDGCGLMAAAGSLTEVAETLTPAMSDALAVLDERRGTAPELGFNGGTLLGLVDRGLARIEPAGFASYRISPRGKEVLRELLNPTPHRRVTVAAIP